MGCPGPPHYSAIAPDSVLDRKAILENSWNILFGAAQLSCLIPLYALWKWGRFQYGRGWLWTPREALYLNASDETKETLEKFFAYIQREDGPKAYFRDRKGQKHYLDRHYSFGKLRVLLLAPERIGPHLKLGNFHLALLGRIHPVSTAGESGGSNPVGRTGD
ncbi:hypothetical protein [Sphingopyxis flava]|uniref:hypothetical protein n=1 Tax=Sphingopyxis flava TaxID=1507287 RepID=UPI0011164694|nr:hypothetical protein [Sphingopyxis flava]